MKYAFVAPDAESICLQYRDFASIENGMLIKLADKNRRFAKLLSICGMGNLHCSYWLYEYLLKKAFTSVNDDSDERICFILYSRVYESFRAQICKFLRKNYKDCIIVVYYGDLISRHIGSINEAKKDADLVCVFDEEDAKIYEVDWLLEPFSESIREFDFLSPDANPIRWDVTFVGHAKNRYKKIIKLYEKLTEAGLVCDFNIVGVPEKDRLYSSAIKYENLSFRELLRHVVSSRCVAEIMQDKGISPTTRYTESMIFYKNLLTDCVAFESNTPPNVIFFKDIEDIDADKVKEIKILHEYNRQVYYDMFSIKTMLESINTILHKRKIL